MGAYLSSPKCDKDTVEDSNDRLAYVASSMQGWRMSQEVNSYLSLCKNICLALSFRMHIMPF